MSKGKPLGFCKSCSSEIVETVNDSLFREGECDGCEYQRYRTQPALLHAAKDVLRHWESGDLAAAVRELGCAIDSFESRA